MRRGRLRDAVDEALALGPASRRYSFADLRAVQLAATIWSALAERGDGYAEVAGRMRACLDQLALGCHRFDRAEKSAAYRQARDLASLAAMALWLRDPESGDELQHAIETELMPAFAGLLRRSDRAARRD